MHLGLAPCVLSCLFGPSDPSDRPPPLTFDKQVDYIAWYNDFVSKGKKENAYELYKPLEQNRQGQESVPGPPWQILDDFDEAQRTVWRAEDHPKVLTYIQENARFVEIFKRAQELRGYWLPHAPEEGRLISRRLLQLSGMRNTAKIVLVDALRQQPNQGDAMIEAWKLVLGNADHLRQSQSTGLVVSGAAIRVSVYELVRMALAKKVIQGPDLERAFTMIIRADPGEAPSAGWCMVEWAMYLDTLQASSPDGKPFEVGVHRMTDPVFHEGGGPPEIRFEDPVKIAKLTDEDFTSLCKALLGPFGAETARELHRLDQEQREMQKDEDATHAMSRSTAPAYDRLLRAEAQRRATLLCLALHAHKEVRGDWPKSLDEASVPFGREAMKGLLIDPYSGKNFVYTLKDGQPFLYSIAADGKNDEGRHDAHWGDGSNGGDFVFWPYQEPRSARRRG